MNLIPVLHLARVDAATKQLVEQLTHADVLTPRLRDNLEDFALEQASAGEVNSLANDGRPSAGDLRAALDDKPGRFREKLDALREQAAALRRVADECDGFVGDALRAAKATSRGAPSDTRNAVANLMSEGMARLLRLITSGSATPLLTADEEVPFDAKKPIRTATIAMTQRMAALLLAAAVETIIAEEEKKLEVAQKVKRTVMGTASRLREETAGQVAALNAQRPRTVVPTDIEFDGARAMKALGAIEPIDWIGFILEQAASGDMPSATAIEREVQRRVADWVEASCSLTDDRLLPTLMGRSVEGTCDALARAASPLAPLLQPRK